jgi:glycosyltransferase involved in cell wall biosynthesis
MRICLAVHGFPPLERTGVENYTAALAAALARRGHAVEVFAPRVRPDLPQLSARREERDGYAVTWISTNVPPRDPGEALEPPGVAERFGAFLDRERPEVVHFQHLVKLGLGLVGEARKRGLPVVYTAHDYYAICHRYTLLRPDLKRCDTIGDAMVCARCDLALAALNRRREELGDYQMGALPEQLDEREREGLAALLDEGDPTILGMTPEDLDAAFDLRQVLDGRRAEAYHALDRILAPTEHLAARLRAGGIGAERIAVLPYGVDTGRASEAGPRPRSRDAAAPLAIGYLSGMAKHKGAHVLLDAFEAMRAPATLHLFGGSTDARYAERMRARAHAVGATWHGPFEPAELGACLSAVDVVVVPSIWIENQPLVIREAFAAGRPVVAPQLGAFPESVRDGVDGLLYAPDDPAALAAALDRLATEEGLFERLAAGIAPVHGVDAQAGELEAVYAELRAARLEADERGEVLPSLRALTAAHARLDALPTRALFERALGGLAGLRRGLGDAAGTEDLLWRALRAGSEAQEELRDRGHESRWMQANLAAEEAEGEWLRDVLAGKDDELRALKAERDWLRETIGGKDAELEWLRGLRAAHEAELASLRGQLGALQAQIDEMAAVGDALSAHLRRTAETGLSALDAEGGNLGAEMAPLLDVVRRTVDGEVGGRRPGDDDTQVLDALVLGLQRGLVRLREIEVELRWRREEMRAASTEADGSRARGFLRRTGLGRRALDWAERDWTEGAP